MVLGVSVAFGAVVWYRYAVAHVQSAIQGGRQLQPELFGGVAASPFIGVALLLLVAVQVGKIVLQRIRGGGELGFDALWRPRDLALKRLAMIHSVAKQLQPQTKNANFIAYFKEAVTKCETAIADIKKNPPTV